jgi:uncharacterized protein (TIGR03435 family)
VPTTGRLPIQRPSIFVALQEQLGLRLESAKGIVDTLFIDEAEKPSADQVLNLITQGSQYSAY